MKTVIGLFDEFHEAQTAVRELETRNFDRADVSVVANNLTGEYAMDAKDADIDQSDAKKHAMAEGAKTGAGAGAVVGTGVGGVVGLLAGLGTIFIPGIGPIVAAGPLLATLTGAGVGAAAGAAIGGLVGALTQVGVPEHDAQFYAEAVRRGGTLVIVAVADDRASEVADVLSDAGAVDVEKRREHFVATGYSGYSPELPPYTADQIEVERNHYRTQRATAMGSGVAGTIPTATAARTTATTTATTASTDFSAPRVVDQASVAVPVVEEELKVGKRVVERGHVQVTARVHEIPVQERVTLREEHVTVQRRAVDRPVTPADTAAFKEGAFDLTEYAEEAVISKEARVVEEVVVQREVQERTETVRDTVRRTDVEVENVDHAVRQPSAQNKPVPPPPPKTTKHTAS